MDQTENLLQTSYQTSRMGAHAISTLLPKIQDQSMRNLLVSHMTRYDDLSHRASEEMVRRGKAVKESPISEKLTDMMVQIKAGITSDPSHLAEMLIRGAEMSVNDSTRALKSAPGADPESYRIASEVGRLSQKIVEDLKPFL